MTPLKGALLGAAIVTVVAVVAKHDDGDSSANTAAPAANEPHVTVIASQSYCSATGVTDPYTGDGKVFFEFALRNTGGAGTVSLTPVRYYSDGGVNMADTMIDIPVPAHSVKRGSSLQMTYEAHEHDVVSCGLQVDFGDEVPIEATHV